MNNKEIRGKVIAFPNITVNDRTVEEVSNTEEKVELMDFPSVEVAKHIIVKNSKKVNSTSKTKKVIIKKKKMKINKKKIIFILYFLKKLCSTKLGKRVVSTMMIALIATLVIARGEKFEANISTESKVESGTFAEDFNSEMDANFQKNIGESKYTSDDVNTTKVEEKNVKTEEDEKKENSRVLNNESELTDVSLTLSPKLEGEYCAFYVAEIRAFLPSEKIKIKDGQPEFKSKDIEFEVISINPDMTTEELAVLPSDLADDIAKESIEIKKEVNKELKKSKIQDYFKTKIEEEIKNK